MNSFTIFAICTILWKKDDKVNSKAFGTKTWRKTPLET